MRFKNHIKITFGNFTIIYPQRILVDSQEVEASPKCSDTHLDKWQKRFEKWIGFMVKT